MSFLEEYEMIRKGINNEECNSINEYLRDLCPKEQYEKYQKELQTINNLPFEKWVVKKKELEAKYNIVYLPDILCKTEYWERYVEWHNENHLHRKVDIIDIWISDYNDIRCNALLYENDKEIANIVASYDEMELGYSIGDENLKVNERFFIKAFKNIIYEEFDKYSKLPKISECSNLLQEIYDIVCKSRITMCHISNEDWENYYIDKYGDNDLSVLKDEIKKYGLEYDIEIDAGEYKIVGYGDLEISFNDDRNINKLLRNDDFEIQ